MECAKYPKQSDSAWEQNWGPLLLQTPDLRGGLGWGPPSLSGTSDHLWATAGSKSQDLSWASF